MEIIPLLYDNVYFGPDEECTRGAYNEGITKGYSSGEYKGKFGVGLNVSREDTVTFIYRMAGKPSYSTGKTFTDVKTEKDLEKVSGGILDDLPTVDEHDYDDDVKEKIKMP